MKTIKIFSAFLIIFSAFNGCAEEPPLRGEKPANNIIVIDSAKSKQIVVGQQELILPNEINVKKNDILISDLGMGFGRKIKNIKQINSSVQKAITEIAELEDVIGDHDVKIQKIFMLEDVDSIIRDSTSLKKYLNSNGLSLNFSESYNNQIFLNWIFGIEHALDYYFENRNNFHVIFSETLRVDMTTAFNSSLNHTFRSSPIRVFYRPIIVKAGFVPILLTVKLNLSIALETTGNISGQVKYIDRSKYDIGIRRNNGNWQTVFNRTVLETDFQKGLTGTAQAKLSVFPDLELFVYETAGVILTPQIYCKIVLSSEKPRWKLLAGTDVKSMVKENIFGNGMDKKIYSSEYLVKQETNTPPAKPTLISPRLSERVDSCGLRLQWNCSDPDNDVLIYTIKFYDYYGQNTPVQVVKTSQKYYDFINARTGRIQYWTVTAFDAIDSTTSDYFDFFVRKLFAPSAIYPAQNVSDVPTNLKFQWKRFECVSMDLYYFQLSTDSNFIHLLNNSVITDTFLNISNLSFNTRYFWRIKNKNYCQTSEWSFPYKFMTAANSSFPAPTLVSPINNSANTPLRPTFQWSSGTNAIRYIIEISEQSNFSNLVLRDSTSQTWIQIVQTLNPNKSYYWRVKTKNAQNIYSSWSSAFNFVTINSTITVLNPGTLWKGYNYYINFQTSNLVSNTVRIHLYRGGVGPQNFVVQIAAAQPVNQTSVYFEVPLSKWYNNVPVVVGNDYKIAVQSADSTVTGWSSDFAIIKMPFITITYPQGGEILHRGLTYQIQWFTTNLLDDSVKIECYKGSTMVYQLAASEPKNRGSYPFMPPHTWPPPNGLPLKPGTDYRIAICSKNGTWFIFTDEFSIF